ncbi:PRK06851 family protein [Aneurinibacillus thermoaerophilus]|uniref:PRK06851 family protein n=1 Tax=Aneurinibacillus thermoaerophilus TaxID=143495 RepID=UPI002E232A89|nr:PRK06851 family protein [Aneurinibacillus thermoaerophilus]MED0677790.1 PRK06851 family protein [Aneurinibacillus thermoaerophilus]MED0737539.1 PRK06851 family protein [Aneurinibacillus thermoaerophilus]MED0762866.1 PRK06851 family protein [Aneurinibacillus thermoaerophilus]
MGKVRNIYAAGNTARGYYHFYESVLQNLERLFILQGGPGTGKSSLIKAIGEEMMERGYEIEWIHCPSDNHSVDGVIIAGLKVGIVDGTAPRVIKSNAPGAVEEYVDIGTAWDVSYLRAHKVNIMQLNDAVGRAFQKAYDAFAQALRIHDEWERFYIENMNVVEANKVTDEVIERIIGEQVLPKAATVRRMFLGAATPEGPVDHIQNLTEDIAKRYFIKGRPGSGKSTMLKKLAAVAEQRGYNVEIYHCGLDPHSLDMVIIPEKSIAIFDSTAPHEHFPTRDSDEIIDMYTRLIAPGTDEKYAAELQEIKAKYSAVMKEGTAYLAEAKAIHDERKNIYAEATDFGKVKVIQSNILSKIDSLIVSVENQ